MPDRHTAPAPTIPNHHETPAERHYRIDTRHTYFTSAALDALRPRASSILTINPRCPQQHNHPHAYHCPRHDCLVITTRAPQPGDTLTRLDGNSTILTLGNLQAFHALGRITSTITV